VQAEDDATFDALKRYYREGIPARSVAEYEADDLEPLGAEMPLTPPPPSPGRTERDATCENSVIHPTHATHSAARHRRRARILLRPIGNHGFRRDQEASNGARVL